MSHAHVLRLLRASILLTAVLISHVACKGASVIETPGTPGAAPSSAHPDVTRATGDNALVGAADRELVLGVSDLPPGFQLAAEPVVDEDGYTVVYVRVAAVQEPAAAAGHLLGVTVNLRTCADLPAAIRRYDELASRDAEAIAEDIRATSGDVSDVSVVPIDASLDQADVASAFRVRYAIHGLPLFEYRYRFRTSNVVGNLSVSARGVDGTEPSLLRQEARGIANRQTRRVAEALP